MNIIFVSLIDFQKYQEKIPVQNSGKHGNWLFRLSDTEFNRHEVELAVKKINFSIRYVQFNTYLMVSYECL
jgi:hypothetical protein